MIRKMQMVSKVIWKQLVIQNTKLPSMINMENEQ